ncbi:MAG: FAD-dependent oxidoreductase [Planctomycetaceae bacterium]|nr:FAD-dependent oxidoreductase [Planctomycetaceae bacterium]
MDQWDVAVIGAGPAGLTAACRAAVRGRKTLVLEKNRKPGVKILISGGGHCNLTHAADARGIVKAFRAQGRFLHSALAAFSPQQLVELMESEGVPMTVLPNGKILPANGRATDVLAALMRRVARRQVSSDAREGAHC